MKSPQELRMVLRKQWENANLRESRLLSGAAEWPIRLAIGRPSPREIHESLDEVKQHLDAWRRVTNGEVTWQPTRYRVASSPIEVPVYWNLYKPSDWIQATGDQVIRSEFQSMATLVEQTASQFHSLFIRRRSLWLSKPLQEVVQAARLASAMSPGCANGLPLRLFSMEGIDTKFFERNSTLITALLDERFDGQVSSMGLESFLGAFQEGEHWLLVMDLDGALLPFKKLRVRSSDLKETALPGSHLLIVENESCHHCVPKATGAIAILGTGFDLNWTEGVWLSEKEVAYWGDIDSWGLQLLSRARAAIPHLSALLMTEATFDEFSLSAVPEPVVASDQVPDSLSDEEARLYNRLRSQARGRLEQEFLPTDRVQREILQWIASTS